MKKMKKQTIKKFISLIVLSLFLMPIFSLALTPITYAQTVETYAQLAVNPNPVGINQMVNVIVWVQPVPPAAGEVFNGFEVTITTPDGNTETLGPTDSWPVGAAFFAYTPTTVGDYTFTFTYPGQTMSSEEDYQPATSQLVTLTVQEEPISAIPEIPRGEYIDGQINSELRSWAPYTGSWLMTYYNSTYTGYGDSGGGYNPYSEAPRSSHIRWVRQADIGGLIGGASDTVGEYSGLSYDSYGNPPIIMFNRLYVNTNPC